MTSTSRRRRPARDECRGELLGQSRRGRADGRGPAGAGRAPGRVRVVPAGARRAGDFDQVDVVDIRDGARIRALVDAARAAERPVRARAAARDRSSGCGPRPPRRRCSSAAAPRAPRSGGGGAPRRSPARAASRAAVAARAAPARASACAAGSAGAPVAPPAPARRRRAGPRRATGAVARTRAAAGDAARHPRRRCSRRRDARAAKGSSIAPPRSTAGCSASSPERPRRWCRRCRSAACCSTAARRARRWRRSTATCATCRAGPLVAEALYGKGRALEALGDGAEERRTWERLVTDHAGSAYAPHARRRLAALR